MKIFCAGLMTETNSFSPFPTTLADFDVLRGADVEKGEQSSSGLDLTRFWGPPAKAIGAHLVFSLMASAQPAGVTRRAAYETLRDEILSDLRAAMPVDVVLLLLHGAMIAEGHDDCESDILSRVRSVVGPDAAIGVEFDLHCNLSTEKIACADVVVAFKEYPHRDIAECAQELFDLTTQMHQRRIRPKMSVFDCRMVGLFPTTRPPMSAFVDLMRREEKDRAGILSISLAHGFPFSDASNISAKILVVTESDKCLGELVARELGLLLYQHRRCVGFESLSLPIEIALPRALTSSCRPVVVADQSDNVGAGAPGDSTYVLEWLLNRQVQDVAMGIFYDPDVVTAALRAGVGASINIQLGGKVSEASGRPIPLEASVTAIASNYMHALPQRNAEPWLYPAGDVAAIRSNGLDIVVSCKRCQCVSPSIFTDLGLSPCEKKILIPKSTQHFHDGFAQVSNEIIYMAGPGAVSPDPRRIPYSSLKTAELYPWTENPLRV